MAFDYKQAVESFWKDMNHHEWERLQSYFHTDAKISWPNTDEIFTVEDYLRVNRLYPGQWKLTLEDVQMTERNIVSIVLIQNKELFQSLRAVTFFRFESGLIVSLTEYFADDAKAPKWRAEWKKQAEKKL